MKLGEMSDWELVKKFMELCRSDGACNGYDILSPTETALMYDMKDEILGRMRRRRASIWKVGDNE
jgi:hypothetical protein